MKNLLLLLWGFLFHQCSYLFREDRDCLLVRALRPLLAKGVRSHAEKNVYILENTFFEVRFSEILRFPQFELPFYGSAVRAPPQNA